MDLYVINFNRTCWIICERHISLVGKLRLAAGWAATPFSISARRTHLETQPWTELPVTAAASGCPREEGSFVVLPSAVLCKEN